MRKIILLLTLGLFAFNLTAQDAFIIRIENTFSVEQKGRVVVIPWEQVSAKNRKLNASNLVVTDLRTQQQVPYQLERRGGKDVLNLLLLVDLPAGTSREYTVTEGKPAAFPVRTFGRYIPERKDDFAWENDRVAFRMYGKALEGSSDNGYGTDVWAKRVNYPIIDKWYKKNDYHVDHGEGLDYYKVGLTLGAGDIAPFEDGKIWFSGNYQRWVMLDNGPLRTTFRLEYNVWNVAGRTVRVNKTISIDAGSQLNRVEVEYFWNDDKPLNLVVGLVKRPTAGVMLLDEQAGLLAYWEPVHGGDGTMGTACLVDSPAQMLVNKDHLMATLMLQRPGTITYYNGAAWDKAGEITSAEQWFNYLKSEKLGQRQPMVVSVR